MKFEDAIKNKDKIDWSFHFLENEFDKDKITKEDINFLCKKLSFIYQENLYVENPFAPFMSLVNGYKTANIEDLTNEDLSIIKETAEKDLSNFYLKAKFYDILGCKENIETYKKLSADNFILHTKNMIIIEKSDYLIVYPLKRALFLYYIIKDKQTLDNAINDILSLVKNKKCEFAVYLALCEFLERFYPKALASLIPHLENFTQKTEESAPLLTIIETIIKYYKSIHNEQKVDKWSLEYVRICEKLNERDSKQGYNYIQMAIDILDKEKFEEKINELHFTRQEAERKFFKSLNMQTFTFGEKVNESLKQQALKINNLFKNAPDGLSQLLILLKTFNAYPLKYIEKQLKENEKNPLKHIFNTISFNSDNVIIYDEFKSNENKRKEFEISKIYNLNSQVMYNIVLNSFVFYLKLDSSLKGLLKEIISKNLFVPKNRVDSVFEYVCLGLNKKIRTGLYGLITQFEYGCREYLKNRKHLFPAIGKGGKEDPINLNDMFIQKDNKKNKFRDNLIEVLGEDLVQEIEYLACRKLSGNIRNKYAHEGHEKEGEFYVEEVNLFFLILEVYCLGYDSQL